MTMAVRLGSWEAACQQYVSAQALQVADAQPMEAWLGVLSAISNTGIYLRAVSQVL